MIPCDVLQIIVSCVDRPTQSLFAEAIYRAMPLNGQWRVTLHCDSSVMESTHDRKGLEAGMQVSKRAPRECWPEDYWGRLANFCDTTRLTVAIQDAALNAHEYNAAIKAYLREGYNVYPIVICIFDEETSEWQVPPHTEFYRATRLFWREKPKCIEDIENNFPHEVSEFIRALEDDVVQIGYGSIFT